MNVDLHTVCTNSYFEVCHIGKNLKSSLAIYFNSPFVGNVHTLLSQSNLWEQHTYYVCAVYLFPFLFAVFEYFSRYLNSNLSGAFLLIHISRFFVRLFISSDAPVLQSKSSLNYFNFDEFPTQLIEYVCPNLWD